MGYNTDFEGVFVLKKKLKENHRAYLNAFANTRRMCRDKNLAEELDDPIRIAVGLPVGVDGGYYVGAKGFKGQDKDISIVEYNYPPEDQPGLWCQWVPSDDGKAIGWNYTEKFYEFVPWINYIIDHFLIPWEYSISGDMYWYGEDRNDIGIISIKDNIVTIKKGKISYE